MEPSDGLKDKKFFLNHSKQDSSDENPTNKYAQANQSKVIISDQSNKSSIEDELAKLMKEYDEGK